MSAHTAISTLRRRLLGVLFIAMLFAFVGLSVASYNRVFDSFVSVRLTTDTVGNQLRENSDVKVRGVLVGTVRKITPRTRGAELELALDPAKADLIPDNVSARFLPKTVFGERYVALQIPAQPSDRTLRNGDEISQDRSATAVEVEQALNDLLPVLQAVQPQKLSSTLTAVSTALAGRGAALGQTLSQLGQYVGEVNPHLSQFQQDLRLLTDVSDTYSDAAPDLVSALSDLTVTSQTIAQQRSNLSSLYANLTTASSDLKSFLDVNGKNLIQLTDTARPTLELLAEYSPEYPCLLQQMAALVPKADKAFGKGTDEPGLHVTIEIVNGRGKYVPGQDEPEWDDKRGPRCYDPSKWNPWPQNPPDGPLQDGAKPSSSARNLPGSSTEDSGGGATSPSAAAADAAVPTLANSVAEQRFVSQLIAGRLGVAAGDVSAWQALLIAPVFRGAEVTVQ